MPPKSDHIDATVTLGDGVAVIRETGSSRPHVVGVLSVECDDDGRPVRVFLDQMVHRPQHRTLGPWRVWGAISSILEMPNPSPAN